MTHKVATQTMEVTPEQAKILERYLGNQAYHRKRNQRPEIKAYHRRYNRDVKAGRRQAIHRPVIPDKVFDKLLGALPGETLQHITGFLEGDGTINYWEANRRPHVGFGNLDESIIRYIKNTLRLSREVGDLDKNGDYLLSIDRQEHVQALLRALSPYFCCPKTIERIRGVFDECSYSVDFDLVEHEPTIPWFVGFGFDAEGNKMDPHTYTLTVSQKDRRPLEKLQKLFNSGKIKRGTDGRRGFAWYVITWSGDCFRELIPRILKYSENRIRRDALIATLYFRARENPGGVWGEFYRQLRRDGLL